MATQKKGCGFLITSLVLFLAGGLVATLLGIGAFSTGKKVVDEIGKTGTSFVTPESATYEPKEDSAVTVWLTGDIADVDLDKIAIHVTDTASKTSSVASKPSENSHVGNKHLLGTFEVKEGKSCEVRASGIEDGRHLTIASISMSTALSLFGMGHADRIQPVVPVRTEGYGPTHTFRPELLEGHHGVHKSLTGESRACASQTLCNEHHGGGAGHSQESDTCELLLPRHQLLLHQ